MNETKSFLADQSRQAKIKPRLLTQMNNSGDTLKNSPSAFA